MILKWPKKINRFCQNI